MKTKIIHFVMVAAMCAATMLGAAAQQFEYDGLNYNILSDNTVEVTYATYPNVYSGEIVIPTQVIYEDATKVSAYQVSGIGNYAFSGSEIYSIMIPYSVKRIGEGAFFQCNSLTWVSVPGSVESIETLAFADCEKLPEISVNYDNEYYCSVDGVLYDKAVTRLLCCPGAKREIDIPASVTEIGKMAFYGCNSFTAMDLPDNLQSLGENAFYGCENLESVNIGKSLSEMGIAPYAGCGKLVHVTIDEANEIFFAVDNVVYGRKGKFMLNNEVLLWCPNGLQSSVTIPDGVGAIYDSAFEECRKLSSVKIPDSMMEIHDKAFRKCSSLTEIAIPQNVYHLGDGLFQDCEKLSNVSLPKYYPLLITEQMFSGCKSLKTITIPDGWGAIFPYAFYGCSNLVSVTIGCDVWRIESGAFSNCSSLINIYCLPMVPPEPQAESYQPVFDQSVCSQATLYVPVGSKADYEAAPVWKDFANIVETDFSGVENAVADSGIKVCAIDGTITVIGVADGTTVEVYGIGGGCVYRGIAGSISGLPAGIYVVRTVGQATKVVLK